MAKQAKQKQAKYYEVSKDVEDYIFEKINTWDANLQNSAKVVGCSTIKNVVAVKPANDLTAFLYEDLLYILVNEDLFNMLSQDDEALNCNIDRQLNKVVYDLESGKVKISNDGFFANCSLKDDSKVLSYKRAHEIEKLALEQLKEKSKENETIDDSE